MMVKIHSNFFFTNKIILFFFFEDSSCSLNNNQEKIKNEPDSEEDEIQKVNIFIIFLNKEIYEKKKELYQTINYNQSINQSQPKK
jgi:hypothetical protein